MGHPRDRKKTTMEGLVVVCSGVPIRSSMWTLSPFTLKIALDRIACRISRSFRTKSVGSPLNVVSTQPQSDVATRSGDDTCRRTEVVPTEEGITVNALLLPAMAAVATIARKHDGRNLIVRGVLCIVCG